MSLKNIIPPLRRKLDPKAKTRHCDHNLLSIIIYWIVTRPLAKKDDVDENYFAIAVNKTGDQTTSIAGNSPKGKTKPMQALAKR